jgi:multidrug efflux pump subunit AcrB
MIQRIVRLSADNPVLVNMVFIVTFVGGLLSWNQLPKEQFPQVQVDRVIGISMLLGASPEDVEELLLRPMEEAVEDIDDIKHIYGDAIQGRAVLTMEFNRDADITEARTDVERALNEIQAFPEDATTPSVSVIRVTVPVTNIALTGDVNRVELAGELSEELRDIPGVNEVRINGAAERVLRVDLSPEKSLAAQATPATVAQAIQASAISVPMGTVQVGAQETMIRSPRSVASVGDIAELLLPAPTGPPLRLGDVARVYEDWVEPEEPLRVNGQPAIVLTLLRSESADSLKIVDIVNDWIEEKEGLLPQGLQLTSFDDSTIIVRDRLRILASNALIGIALVSLCLALFIGFRNTLLVIWGMPVAYMGALLLMYMLGVSLNVVSTFALLLVTGIIVDDAVIIVENVQRHLEMGKDRVEASIDGTKEVFGAVFASTLTTCLAFAPLLMLEGTVGRVMSIVPSVVIFSLVASLLEAFFILPGHLSHHAKERTGEGEGNRLTRWIQERFRPVIVLITRPWMRYFTLAALIVGLIGVFSLTTKMRTSLTTEGHPYFVLVNIDLPEGSDIQSTEEVLRRVEREVFKSGAALSQWVFSTGGRQIDPNDFSTVGSRYGQLKIGFPSDPEVFDAVPGFLGELRGFLSEDTDIVDFSIEKLEGGPPAGRDIDLKLRSRSSEQLIPAVRMMRDYLSSREAVYDLRDEAGLGSWEYQIEVDRPLAMRLGLSEAGIALAARGALEGEKAVELPIKERKADVRVRLDGMQELDRQLLEDLVVGTGPAGESVRLRQVAQVKRVRSIERIQRIDGQRAVRLSALVDPKQSSAEEEKAFIDSHYPALLERFPDIDLFYGGRLADSKESFSALPGIFLLAVLLIYSVLAVQFRNYLQPLIILSAIPLGLAGVVLGLFCLGMDLSFIAMIGTIGLVGIVVNDSLVLIDFINQRCRSGAAPIDAVVEATLVRLRPILITTVTTVLGLAPLGLGLAGEEPLLAPMAVSISFGLAFATILSLLAVPTLYLVIEDIRGTLRRIVPSRTPPLSSRL